VKHLQVGLLVSFIAALGAVACASAGSGQAKACELEPSDSALAAGRTVYRDCAVDRKVNLLTDRLHPDWQPTSRPRGGCYSTAVEFVVDTAGRPERDNIKVLHSNDRTLTDAVLAMVPQLKYEAAVKNGEHVRQITTFEQKIGVTVTVVPQGSPPPTRPNTRPPNC